MRDRKEYNDQLDDFSKLARQMLEGHRIPVDADSWTEIEQRLTPPNKRHRLWWMAGAAAAVAVVVSIFLFSPPSDIGQQAATIGHQQLVAPQQSISAPPKQEQAKEPAVLIPARGKTLNRSVGLISDKTEPIKSHGDNTMTGIEKSLSIDSATQVKEQPLSKTIADAGSDTKTSDSVPAKTKTDVNRKEDTKIWLPEKKRNKTNDWLLAANFASNVSSSDNAAGRTYDAQSEYYNGAYLKNGIMAVPDQMPATMANDPSTLSKADHSLPLSFGLTIRKNLTNRIGVETGLVYTYLSSRFSTTMMREGTVIEAKQELHYLGIPLNVVVYLWDNPDWSIYLSAGGMGEKGLRRNYTYTGQTTNTSVKESIDGLQWSLNASLGISYRFAGNWGVYFEPRYSYYFDNNQPISIRTDKQSVFGLNAGLRFEF